MFRRQKQNPVAKNHTRKAELAMQMQSTFEILESVGMSALGQLLLHRDINSWVLRCPLSNRSRHICLT